MAEGNTIPVTVPWHLERLTPTIVNIIASYIAINVGRSTIARYRRAKQGVYQGIIAPDYLLRIFLLYYACMTVFNLQNMLKPENQTFSFDPYTILDVPTGADADAIKKAYKTIQLDVLDPERLAQVELARRALSDEEGIQNFKEFGHPDGPIVLSVWAALPDMSGWSGKVAYGFGIISIILIAFALFAWWANRRHEAKEQRSIGILQQDIKVLGESMSARPDCLLALIKNPALTRSLQNMRLNKLEETEKQIGKDLASMQMAEEAQENQASYEFLREELTKLGARWNLMIESNPSTDGKAGEETEQKEKEEEKEKVVLTEEEYNARQIQEHVALLIMSKFRSNVLTSEVLEEQMTKSVLQERALVLRIAAKLLDVMLLSICFPQRALAASHATLKLTSEFASGLWNAESEECIKIQREQLQKEGQPLPSLTLIAEISDAAAVEEGVMPGDSLTLKITLTRHHHDQGEDVPGDQPVRPEDIREAYWLVIEMSNGEQSRFAAAAPLVVQRLTQREVTLSMPMKAPNQPGDYTLKLRGFSPTMIGSLQAQEPTPVGCNVETSFAFKVVGQADTPEEDARSPEEATADAASKKDN